MKFPKEVLLRSVVEGKHDAEYEIEFIEELEPEDEGKYESCTIIFKRQGKYYSTYYAIWEDWGANFDHWEDEVDCNEVEQQAVIKTAWVLK